MRRTAQLRRHSLVRRTIPQVEQLETRLAPATLVSPTTLTYQDIDHDMVTVMLSKPVLTSVQVANNVFTFNTGSVSGSNGNHVPQQLQKIDFTQLPNTALAQGMSVTVTAVKASLTSGDGFANIGAILATSINLGNVSIHGDLGKIVAGSGSATTPAVTSLTVQSLGRLGIATQAPGGDLVSVFTGALGSLTVKSDVNSANVSSTSTIGSVFIGGSLIGGDTASAGRIASTGNMGTVHIVGSIFGGIAADTGEVSSGGTITSVVVSGSVVGGTAADSGRIASVGNLGAVTIGADIRGGSGSDSGEIITTGTSATVARVTISGSLVGGANTDSGFVSSSGNMGPVVIRGQVQGGGGADSAAVDSGGTLGTVTIGGSLVAGSNADTGEIASSGNMGFVTVGGDLRGSAFTAAADSGAIDPGGNLVGVKVGGSLVGGLGGDSGEILTGRNENIGTITIGGSLVGNSAGNSGDIDSGGSIGTVTIGGSLIGGAGDDSGEILSGSSMGFVTVGGSLIGLSGGDTGEINAGGTLAGARIGGSLVGGAGGDTGEILSGLAMGPVTIGGDIQGGSGGDAGDILAGGTLTSVTVKGSILGGSGGNAGSITAGGNTGQVTIGGNLTGGGGGSSGTVSVTGKLAGITVGAWVIGGSGPTTGTIISTGDMGALKIMGSLVGGSISGNAAVSLDESGYVQGQRIASVFVGGSIIAGSNTSTNGATLTHDGSIRAAHDMGAVTVKGSLVGNSTNPVILSAQGLASPTTSDLAIASLTVGGRVEWATILAGYDVNETPVDGQASIGAVRVSQDWIASNLVAGAQTATGATINFGTAGDHEIGGAETTEDLIARIASILIGGQAIGNPDSTTTQHFGFDAESVGPMTVGGTVLNLNLQPGLPLPVGFTNEVTALDVP